MRTRSSRRVPVAVLAAATTVMVAAPAQAAGDDGSGVKVVNTETVQIYTNAAGEVQQRRVYEQLDMTGKGKVDLTNPISTSGLRNLDGFGGFDVKNGEQVVNTTVDGEKKTRSVSDYKRGLPLDVAVVYKLDGKTIEPGDVVGKSGRLEVLYTVKNITSSPQQLTFDDGKGGKVTKTVAVPVPMVGSLTTTAPPSFDNVRSDEANLAGDGKGGTKLSFTMTLLAPVGSKTARFGYTADITDGVVPRAEITALPVDPLQSPSFASAATSYQGGASTGAELAAGATTIDGNLLKLRDGASSLLAGLLKLRDGAQSLQDGLQNQAAPGARKLAAGADALDTGLDRLEDGSYKLANGTGDLKDGASTLSAGSSKVDTGAHQVAGGAGKVAGGATSALAGSRKLTGGLKQISDGLGGLADGATGLPSATAGIKLLQGGVDQISAGLGTPDDAETLIGGLTTLETGLGRLGTGAGQLTGGLQQLTAANGLPAAVKGVDDVQAGLAGAVSDGGSFDALIAGLDSLSDNVACAGDPQCAGTAAALAAGARASKQNLGQANQGLQSVSAGLAGAVSAIDGQLIPGATQLQGGVADSHAGAVKLTAGAQVAKEGLQTVRDGLDDLAAGVTTAVAGVAQLSTGAEGAYTGSATLSSGLGDLSAGAGAVADGADQVAGGTSALKSGSAKLAGGAGQLDDGASQLASGATTAKDGSSKLATGAGTLSDGLSSAADGSGQLTDGLTTAADGAPQLVDGAQQLSDQGTKKLIAAGTSTAQNYGELYATLVAGSKRAKTESMAFGAPKDALGLTAYSYVIKGADGEGSRNLTRGLGGVALLGAGGAVFALRRRLG